jgi:tripartite-type tricarboxylate transporter receptor subunit TctC
VGLFAGGQLVIVNTAFAEYPEAPIRLIIPFASGSATDTSARIYAAALSRQLVQQVVPDNRPGAGGAIGMELLARAAANGYTIAYAGAGPLAINRSVAEKLPYDVEKDFAPISQAIDAPLILAVSPTLPVKTVKDLVALAKSRPGQLSNGSSGTGTIGYLAGELFKIMTNTRIEHIPYKGGAQAAIDVIAGHVQLIFDPINGVSPFVRSGKMRGLAVTGVRRVGAFPDLPTVAESGVTGYEVTTWGGLIAPARVPAPIVVRLSQEMRTAAASQFVKDSYVPLGAEPRAGTPEEFAALIRRETAKWADVVKRTEANAK